MESKNLLFSLIAVFLALGIGILVGASMGEKALVMNQIVVIERLKEEIIHCKEEIDHYFFLISSLQEDLRQWESLVDDYLDPLLIKNQLQGIPVKILFQGELPDKVENFLRLSGCSYTAYCFANTGSFEEIRLLELLKKELQYEPDYEPDMDLGGYLADELSGLLQDKKSESINKISEILNSNNLLEIVALEPEPEQTLFLPGDEADVHNKGPFIVAGKIDFFLQSIIKRIGEEGKKIIFVLDDEEEQSFQKISGNRGDLYLINGFNKFFDRLELLKIILEINGEG